MCHFVPLVTQTAKTWQGPHWPQSRVCSSDCHLWAVLTALWTSRTVPQGKRLAENVLASHTHAFHISEFLLKGPLAQVALLVGENLHRPLRKKQMLVCKGEPADPALPEQQVAGQ